VKKNNESFNNDDNNKITALIKLGIWLVFIVVIFIVVNLGNKNDTELNNSFENSNQEETKPLTYEEKLNKLNDNFKFNYEIKIDNNIYYFSGTRLLTKESGYRLYDSEYVYYFVEDNIIKEVKNGELFDLENLYENIDVNNLKINQIKESIKGKKYIEEENKYNYLLENNKIVTLYSDSENIRKIEIYLGDDYYKLEFSDIGLVKEIKY